MDKITCTIIIFHYESLAFLRACVRQIRRHKRNDINQHIIIAEQSKDASVISVVRDEFYGDDISVVQMDKYGSGYAIDYVIRNMTIESEYICTIDVDTIPIHSNWLYVPIKLIETEGFTFVGVHAEIESAYAYMGNFFPLCQHFRVGRTKDFIDLSLNGGFSKNDCKKKLVFTNNKWHGWSDDGVIAHWWEDTYREHDKLGLKVSHYLGVAPLEGRYGRYTDDLVFHFGFSYNWKMVADAETAMGAQFLTWMERMATDGFSDEMLTEILDGIIPLESPVVREVWRGQTKTIEKPNDLLNAKIERLKKE